MPACITAFPSCSPHRQELCRSWTARDSRAGMELLLEADKADEGLLAADVSRMKSIGMEQLLCHRLSHCIARQA